MRNSSFAKGHGTHNDFVILLDRENLRDPSPGEVQALCDRRAGIGGDGLLRAVRAGAMPEWDGPADLWFMDYRNADGSIAELCGNGLRVFVRYLLDNDLAAGPDVSVATRTGVCATTELPDRRIRVAMGPVRQLTDPVAISVRGGPEQAEAVGVDVGNPHAVTFLDEPGDLEALDLAQPPTWSPTEVFPAGVNCEFVRIERSATASEPGLLTMRVYERGSGETWSCGTGTVAAAMAAAQRDGLLGQSVSYRVDVRGGSVEVNLEPGPDGVTTATLTGPAVIVAHGELT